MCAVYVGRESGDEKHIWVEFRVQCAPHIKAKTSEHYLGIWIKFLEGVA